MNKLALSSNILAGIVFKWTQRALARLNVLAKVTGKRLLIKSRQRPQWQQLELPFSRTPVQRWNR